MAAEFGSFAYTAKLRKEVHRNLGAYMTPQAAYLQNLGLETLTIRFERATSSCLQLAKQLQKNSAIVSVNYPGLTSSPYFELSKAQFGDFPGAMFTFNLSSREACFRFLNKLQLIRRATNLFDNKSLAIHPASTIFGTFTAAVRQEMNVSDCTVRISVGLESVNDLMTDILQALN
jgi:O-acetylhomoserine (thiol)-lyase